MKEKVVRMSGLLGKGTLKQTIDIQKNRLANLNNNTKPAVLLVIIKVLCKSLMKANMVTYIFLPSEEMKRNICLYGRLST